MTQSESHDQLNVQKKVLLAVVLMPKRWTWSVIIILTLAGLIVGCSLKINPYNLDTQVLSLGFNSPISFDDFTYDSQLGRVIIPAGETGELALFDPANLNKQMITGFSKQTDPSIPIVGTTSAAEAHGFLFGLDQYTTSIKTVNLSTGKVVSSTALQDAPDYIRYVSATNELWVTEKASSQIEIFSMSNASPPVLQSSGDISVPNGPEALIIDEARGLAFTNKPKQSLTAVIQLRTHSVIYEWGNGCSQARGMAVDDADGYLFVACREGKIVVMDMNNDGFQIANQNYGSKLDFVAYNPNNHHVYLPSNGSGIVAIFQLQSVVPTPLPTDTNVPGTTATPSPTSTPGPTPTPNINTSLLWIGSADTAIGSKCVTTDNQNNIWVCDPTTGQIFVIRDIFPDNSGLR